MKREQVLVAKLGTMINRCFNPRNTRRTYEAKTRKHVYHDIIAIFITVNIIGNELEDDGRYSWMMET